MNDKQRPVKVRATTGFCYPKTAADLAKAKSDHRDKSISWARAEKGDVLIPPTPAHLRSWRLNEFIEEVS